MRAKFYSLPPLSMIARCETPQAETAKMVVDYSLPLDAMTPEQRELALEHGRNDTMAHINAERLLARQNHEGVMNAVLHQY